MRLALVVSLLALVALALAFVSHRTRQQAAPVKPPVVVATVFGTDIFSNYIEPGRSDEDPSHPWTPAEHERRRVDLLSRGGIIKPVLDRWVAENHFEPTEEEIAQCLASGLNGSDEFHKHRIAQASAELASPFIPEGKKGLIKQNKEGSEHMPSPEMRRERAIVLINRWKVRKVLFEKYGGRVIASKSKRFGLDAIGAKQQMLKEAETRRDFVIRDETLRREFWAQFELYGTPEGWSEIKDPKAYFQTPPWAKTD